MQSLMEVVEAYAALGNHRTCTDVDRTTRDWLCQALRSRGATVEQQAYEIPSFRASVTLTCDGRSLDVLPLYYSWNGGGQTDRLHVAEIEDRHSDGGQSVETDISRAILDGRAAGAEAVVLATRCANQGLAALNRSPGDPLDLPVVLVRGQEFSVVKECVAAGKARLIYDAQTVSGRSANVIADFPARDRKTRGRDGRPPIVVTTPLSGWYRCAGERGTGLAIALSVAEALAQDWPVRFVAPTGHELGYYGAAEYLKVNSHPVRAVLHLGSCVAALGAVPASVTGGGLLDAGLRAVAHVPQDLFDDLRRFFAMAEVPLAEPARPKDPSCWMGESELWSSRLAKADFPMISIAGTSPLFHTEEDVPDAATTPHLLHQMEQIVAQVARRILAKNSG